MNHTVQVCLDRTQIVRKGANHQDGPDSLILTRVVEPKADVFQLMIGMNVTKEFLLRNIFYCEMISAKIFKVSQRLTPEKSINNFNIGENEYRVQETISNFLLRVN